MQDKKYYDDVKMKKQKLIFSHEITIVKSLKYKNKVVNWVELCECCEIKVGITRV